MKKWLILWILALAFAAQAPAQDKEPLKLVQTITLPDLARKWDHFGVDIKGNRLFATSEEDDPAVDVIDLKTNTLIRSLTDFKGPHNAIALPEMKKILVVDGEASEVKVLDYNSYKLIGHIELTIDADPYVYDPAHKLLYVVNGGRAAKTPYCLISIIDVAAGKKIADMKLPTNRLESMTLEKGGKKLYVNMTGSNLIGVVDLAKREVAQTWPVTAGKDNVPMQYDPSTHRLFVATRKPSKFVVINTDTGKEVTSLDVADYVDDLAYDAAHHRIYVPGGGGQGAISVVAQKSADDYEVIATIPTKPGAKTGRLVPELNRYYLGVPKKVNQPAAIMVFAVAP